MPLTDQQKEHIMKQSVDRIREFIAQGRVKFPDDLIKYKDSPKFKAIEADLANIPDPKAVERWAEIQKMAVSSEPNLYSAALASFIRQYESNPGSASMVDDARSRLSALTAEIEREDWDRVDHRSVHSLLSHRRKYPTTSHEAEIDRTVWELTDRTSETQVRRYAAEFPDGLYRGECDAIIEAQGLWEGVSTDPDLITLSDYIKEETASPFIGDAIELIRKLKVAEMDKMKANTSTYDMSLFSQMLDEEIFTREELIANEVCTEKTLKYIEEPPTLPDIEQNGQSNPVIHRGATDVFLFGIPSSGKTCVLMGLLGAQSFVYDNADTTGGGAYADNLYLYRSHGKAPGRTYGNFVTQIPGVIRDNTSTVYPINLIEMSGEEFAMKMAYNPENTVSFDDMGSGAAKLLSSDNNKVIFIVIDPTADGLITIATEQSDGSAVKKIVQQDIVITKMVNMLAKNPQVLKRTNAIHFIMTKSDTLGDRSERNNVAVTRIRSLYNHTIENLRELCAKYSLNRSSGNSPMLYTFSLGKFYLGDMFEYDVTDADMIMDNLRTMCQGVKQRGFYDSVKKSVN